MRSIVDDAPTLSKRMATARFGAAPDPSRRSGYAPAPRVTTPTGRLAVGFDIAWRVTGSRRREISC